MDVAFVEGSVSTEEEKSLVEEVREKAKVVVTIGACATSGGIQALRNFGSLEDFLSVYPKPEFIESLEKATPVKEHIKVDYEIFGCPVNPKALEAFIKALLYNRRPDIADYPLCMECKIRGNVCVMDAYGVPCLGPVVRAGCGALCPSFKRGVLRLLWSLQRSQRGELEKLVQEHGAFRRRRASSSLRTKTHTRRSSGRFWRTRFEGGKGRSPYEGRRAREALRLRG